MNGIIHQKNPPNKQTTPPQKNKPQNKTKLLDLTYMHLQELGEHTWEMNLEGARVRREYNAEWG